MLTEIIFKREKKKILEVNLKEADSCGHFVDDVDFARV